MTGTVRVRGTVHDAVDEVASLVPDQRISFPDRGERISYHDLVAASRRVAAGLRAAEVGARDMVAVVAPNSAALLAAVLGASRIGAVACPLPNGPGHHAGPRIAMEHLRRLGSLVEATGVGHMLTAPGSPPLGDRFGGATVLDLTDLTTHPEPSGPLDVEVDAGALVIAPLTAGTRAPSRAVLLTHANVLACSEAITDTIGVVPSDGWGSWLPMCHGMGLLGTITALLNGIQVTLWSPDTFAGQTGRWLDEFLGDGCTISAMPNYGYDHLRKVVRSPDARPLDMSQWRVAVNGGEPVDLGSLNAFRNRFAHHGFPAAAMTPSYGTAEATLVTAIRSPRSDPAVEWVDGNALGPTGRAVPVDGDDPGARAVVCLGEPAPGVALRIGRDGRELPEGEVGEVQLAGEAVAAGGRRGQLGDRTADGWLRSDDLGYLRSGELYVLGRIPPRNGDATGARGAAADDGRLSCRRPGSPDPEPDPAYPRQVRRRRAGVRRDRG